MSTNISHIFLTGATGYIGGAVLQRLLDHPDAKSFKFTVLVRSSEKAEKLKKFGVDVIVGSHEDLQTLEDASSKADVVFAVADADNLDAAKAILRGLKKKHDTTGQLPILIHTSGTGVLADNSGGMSPTDTIYHDDDANQIESIPPTALHRNVDLEVLGADKAGYLKSYIILPSTIYGIATGTLVDEGIANPHSIQIPALIKASLARGQTGMVGEGKNLWPNVHINDIADLYIVLFNAIRSDANTGHGREGFYFGESGEHSLYDVAKEMAKAMHARGKGSDEPTSFTDEECQKFFNGKYLGSNSRCRANRSRAIGWKPTHTTKDLLASVDREVEVIISKGEFTGVLRV